MDSSRLKYNLDRVEMVMEGNRSALGKQGYLFMEQGVLQLFRYVPGSGFATLANEWWLSIREPLWSYN